MSKWRCLVASVVLGAAGVAQASFDLMFVVDGATKSVHRVDPVNNVFLGRVGQGFLNNPLSVALGPNNDLWVLESNNRVRKFNANTGEYMGGFFTSYAVGTNSKLRVSNNRIFITSGSAYSSGYLYSYNLDGSPLNAFSYAGLTEASNQAQGLALIGNRAVVSSYQSGFARNLLYDVSATAAYDGSFVNYTLALASSANPTQLSMTGSNVLMTLGTTQGIQFNPSLGIIGSFGISGFSSVNGLAPGHGDLSYIAGMTPTGAFGLGKYYASTFDFIPPTAVVGSGITDPRDIAVLIAPEPGSMLALGLGALVLLRRRRA